MMYYFILYLLVVLNIYGLELRLSNREEDDSPKNCLAINENFAVLAQNDFYRFTVIHHPFSSNTKSHIVPYDRIKLNSAKISPLTYVYGMVTSDNQNKDNSSTFALIGKDREHGIYLIVIQIDGYPDVFLKDALWRPLTKPYSLRALSFGIHPKATHAYAVDLGSTLCLDINLNVSINYRNSAIWDKGHFAFGRALTVTEDHRLFLLAYRLIEPNAVELIEKMVLCLYVVNASNMSMPIPLGMTELPVEHRNHYFSGDNQYTILSLSLHQDSNMLIVGIPFKDMVIILSSSNKSNAPIIIKKHVSSQISTFFGKSVVMLDGNIYAVLALSIPTLPWSSSQVQVYSLDDMETNPKPIFVFPNNQQSIQKMNTQSSPYQIDSLTSWSSNSIGLVLDSSAALILPASPPGYATSLIENYIDTEIMIYRSKPCIPGTYRNSSSFGPCMVCPAHSKNNGSSGNKCEKCSEIDTLICFPAAINEINITKMGSYDQASPYPESPDSTQFEDILLQKILTFPPTTLRCLFISPIFLACLTIILSMIFFVLIKLLLGNSKYKIYQIYAEKSFGYIDLITEKRFWLGGLISLSLFVLIIFAGWFSTSFARLYPIEQISLEEQASVVCDQLLINAKFSSSLQLLSTRKHIDEKPIFNLLDEQTINLNVQFVSTGFICDDLTMQRNRGHGFSIPSTNFKCSVNDSILNISTNLPQHVVTMQFDLNGPYFIGGLHICLSAPSIILADGKYTAQRMEYCRFFFVPNQTLTSYPIVNIRMTKVINRTISMTLPDNVTYTGIWLPTVSMDTLTDDILLPQKGEYYRYLFSKIVLIVETTESEFYMKNTQEPIARTYEIIFTTILFSILCLDLCGLLFTAVKLIGLPLFFLIRKSTTGNMADKLLMSRNSKNNAVFMSTDDSSSLHNGTEIQK